jgi:prolyl-tRNA editing enzyme YbaK/EbsC (Cys-tRNA(Pro) deacylase)
LRRFDCLGGINLPIYVDERNMALDYVILGGGSFSLKINASPELLRRLPGATVVLGLATALPS